MVVDCFQLAVAVDIVATAVAIVGVGIVAPVVAVPVLEQADLAAPVVVLAEVAPLLVAETVVDIVAAAVATADIVAEVVATADIVAEVVVAAGTVAEMVAATPHFVSVAQLSLHSEHKTLHRLSKVCRNLRKTSRSLYYPLSIKFCFKYAMTFNLHCINYDVIGLMF